MADIYIPSFSIVSQYDAMYPSQLDRSETITFGLGFKYNIKHKFTYQSFLLDIQCKRALSKDFNFQLYNVTLVNNSTTGKIDIFSKDAQLIYKMCIVFLAYNLSYLEK